MCEHLKKMHYNRQSLDGTIIKAKTQKTFMLVCRGQFCESIKDKHNCIDITGDLSKLQVLILLSFSHILVPLLPSLSFPFL